MRSDFDFSMLTACCVILSVFVQVLLCKGILLPSPRLPPLPHCPICLKRQVINNFSVDHRWNLSAHHQSAEILRKEMEDPLFTVSLSLSAFGSHHRKLSSFYSTSFVKSFINLINAKHTWDWINTQAGEEVLWLMFSDSILSTGRCDHLVSYQMCHLFRAAQSCRSVWETKKKKTQPWHVTE